MKIAITGASGLIGTELVSTLRTGGHDVIRVVRGTAKAVDERAWDARTLDPAVIADRDAVIHLAGAGVFDHRWSDAYKKTIMDSRVDGTTAVAAAMAQAHGPQVLLSASAIGYYGDTGDRLTDESGAKGEGFLADVVERWEECTAKAEAAGVRVTHLRTGIVLSGKGGALKLQVLAAKLFAGAPLGSGRQWTSWISLQDEVAAIRHLLTADVSGPVNLVGPAPVTNREFTKTLNAVVHRPTIPVNVPGFVLRAVVGQFADEGILIGQRLVPEVLADSGFVFAHRDLEAALRANV